MDTLARLENVSKIKTDLKERVIQCQFKKLPTALLKMWSM
jgi:hypothetical protein